MSSISEILPDVFIEITSYMRNSELAPLDFTCAAWSALLARSTETIDSSQLDDQHYDGIERIKPLPLTSLNLFDWWREKIREAKIEDFSEMLRSRDGRAIEMMRSISSPYLEWWKRSELISAAAEYMSMEEVDWVTRRWLCNYLEKDEYRTLIAGAARGGNMRLLEKFNPRPHSQLIYMEGGRGGNLSVVQWLHSFGAPWSTQFPVDMVEAEQYEIVEWIFTVTKDVDTRAMYTAAAEKNTKWMEMIYDATDREDADMSEIMERGSLEVVQWCHDRHFQCHIDQIVKSAVISNDIEKVEWVHRMGYPWPEDISVSGFNYGQTCLSVYKHLHSKGVPMRGIVYQAVRFKRMDILQWISDDNIEAPEQNRELIGPSAANTLRLPILRWAKDNGYPMDVDRCLAEAQKIFAAKMRDDCDNIQCAKNFVDMTRWLERLKQPPKDRKKSLNRSLHLRHRSRFYGNPKR